MPVGSLFGIPFRLNPLFCLSLALYGLAGSPERALVAFAAVFLHESAHAVLARGYDLAVGEVELLPFGGVAGLTGMPEPEVEGLVAAAGPCHNLLLASICWLLGAALPGESHLLASFTRANVLIGVFNLLPVLPLDGGRLLRILLARRLGFHRAAAPLARAGRVLALALSLLGLGLAPLAPEAASLILVGLFLYLAADREHVVACYIARADLIRRSEQLVRQGVLPAEEVTAPSGTPIGTLLRRFRPGHYHLVLVVGADGAVWGRLPEADILNGLVHHGPGTPVERLVLGEQRLINTKEGSGSSR